MGDAEAGGALPSQVVVESVDDAEEQPADANREEPAGNTAIEGAAPVGEPLGDAANEDGEGLDVTKTNSEIGAEQGHGDKADGEDTTVEGGVEVADDGVENDMYRHVRQLALEAINAVRCRVVLSRNSWYNIPEVSLGFYYLMLLEDCFSRRSMCLQTTSSMCGHHVIHTMRLKPRQKQRVQNRPRKRQLHCCAVMEGHRLCPGY